MLCIKKPDIGMEAIRYQGRSSLFEDLAESFDTIRNAGVFTDDVFRKSGLPEKVFEHCGYNIKFKVYKNSGPNAMVKIPEIDKNNPILSELEREYRDNLDFHTARKFTGNKFTGTLSLKDCRVYGVFTKLVIPVYITTGLLENKDFTSKNIAAIILHEFGHIWSYFERLIDTTSANWAAASAAERIFQSEKDELKIECLYDLDKGLDVKLSDKETIVKYKNKEAIYTHIVTDIIKQRRNEEGDLMYSHRGFEFSSDQFSARHGAGADLVIGLDTLYRSSWFTWYFVPAYRPWILHIYLELTEFTATMSSLFGGYSYVLAGGKQWFPVLMSLLPFTLYLATYNPMVKFYDDPAGRAKRVRNEIIGELKNNKIDDMRRSEILADIAAIDNVISKIEDKRRWLELIRAYIIPSGIKDRVRMEFQQDIEALGNNELFVSSASLANL